jgi:hypothetical protein
MPRQAAAIDTLMLVMSFHAGARLRLWLRR